MTSRPILPSARAIVNVASVPKRSPFRYPGGKTWLVPYVRQWFLSFKRTPRILVEPFAGGGIVGITAAAENLVDSVVLGELDPAVAAVWRTILSDDAEWLQEQILQFEMNRNNVIRILGERPIKIRDFAFHTILRNRVQRGGILAPGASFVRHGENGNGVASRWYPQTLATRIRDIYHLRDRIEFVEGDGMKLLREYSHRKTAAFFIDPPYTAGGKRAGHRLYSHNDIDHHRLFDQASRLEGTVMLTYDDTIEVRRLAMRQGFRIDAVPMKNTHHAIVNELVITKASGVIAQAHNFKRIRLATDVSSEAVAL